MKITKIIMLTAMLVLASNASATIITFDEVNVNSPSFLSADGAVLAEWVWGVGANDGHAHITSGGPSGNYESGHGQGFQGIRFSSTLFPTLTLSSFDLNGSWLVGLLNDGSGTQYSSQGWSTQATNFTASSIYIYADGSIGRGSLDNVTFGVPVPEPTSLALLGLALAGLGFSRKKKNS